MRILVFSQYFYPENFRINTLCQELVRRGHEVTVLTGYPQYPIGRIYDGYGFDIPYEPTWEGVNIIRVKVHPRGKTPFGMLRNCIDYVRRANEWVILVFKRLSTISPSELILCVPKTISTKGNVLLSFSAASGC